MLNLADARDFAVKLAKEAGEIARKYADSNIEFASKYNTPVTVADTEINKLVIDRCAEAYPGIGVLGEEASVAAERGEWLWVCDPIDGTTPYTLGAQASTFCLALVKDGEPVVGVVYDFSNDNLYAAIKGQGATLNGKPMPKPSQPPMRFVDLMISPTSHYIGDVHRKINAAGWRVTNLYSTGFMTMAVARGRIAAAIYTNKHAWDVAASKVIAEECGCAVTDLDGKEQRYDGELNGTIIYRPEAAEVAQLIIDERQSQNRPQ